MDRSLIDRRPIGRINCYSANFTQSNPQGLASFWRYDVDDAGAVHAIVAQIQAKLDAGFAWVELNQWTGRCEGQDVPTECWNTLPESRRAAIDSILVPAIAAWITEDPTRRFGLYQSNIVRNDRDITKLCPGAGGVLSRPPNMDDADDRAYFRAIWGPLADRGFSFLNADNAGIQAKKASSMAMWEQWQSGGFFAGPVGMAIEAVPHITGNNDHSLNYMPDESWVYFQPVYCAYRYIRSNESLNVGKREWKIDAAASDGAVLFTKDESWQGEGQVYKPTRADVQRVLRNGWRIVSAADFIDPWVLGLARTPTPGDVGFEVVPGGNTVSWTAGTATDDLGAEIGVLFYEVFRADAEEGPYARIGTATGLSYLDPSGTPAHFYRVGSWTEYNQASIPVAAAAPGGDFTFGWTFDGALCVQNTG